MSNRRSFLQHTLALGLAGSALEAALAKAREVLPDSLRLGSQPRLSRPVRLAIVGVGKIADRYFKQAGSGRRAQFVATCAQHLQSAKARAAEYHIAAWFDDYEKMYDAVRPDGVVVVTPNAAHAAPTIAALERGIAVLCEKPMATSWADCQAMVAASKRSGAPFLCLPYDANTQFRAALKYLNEATLGVFTGTEAQLLWPGAPWDNWYYNPSVVGGGAGLEVMVYPVSSLISLLGPAQRVTGFVNNLIPQRILGDEKQGLIVVPPRDPSQGKVVKTPVDDNASLLIEWKGGQQALTRGMECASIFRKDTTVYGRHGTLWITGSEVVVQSPQRALEGLESLTWNGNPDCYRVPFEPMKDISEEGLLDHFADCIQGLTKPTCGGEQQLHVHEILFKGYEAARTGQAQALTTTFTPWHELAAAFFDTQSRPV